MIESNNLDNSSKESYMLQKPQPFVQYAQSAIYYSALKVDWPKIYFLWIKLICLYRLFVIFGMHKKILLSAGQIYQLREALTKMVQQNMISFSSRVSVNCQFESKNDLELLYTFCQREYAKLQTHLQRMAEFTFEIMSNVEMIWEQVHHRQNKILELRQSFSSATDYMEELKMENDEIRSKLTEAETYIQCIQYQKEILDALYYDRQRSSFSMANDSGRNLSKCVSERSLNWQQSHLKKKNLNYQKLKQYINGLKQQRQQLEGQLMSLTKQFQLKCQQCKKANFFIQHLVERLNKKCQLKEYIESLNNYTNQMKEYNKIQFNPEQFLKILERTQNSATSSKRSLVILNEDLDQRNLFPCIDSFSTLSSHRKSAFPKILQVSSPKTIYTTKRLEM